MDPYAREEIIRLKHRITALEAQINPPPNAVPGEPEHKLQQRIDGLNAAIKPLVG